MKIKEGKIIKLISDDYTVLSNGIEYICKSRGKFRKLKIRPLVGDNVIFDSEKKYVLEILPRKNQLTRPVVANIDQAFIVMSVVEPSFSKNLLDKLLVIIEYNNIKPVICLTKMDLLKSEELDNINEIKNYYQKIGYQVLINNQLKEIEESLKNKITVITGQTGVGKSTLLNKLMPELNLKTGEISRALGRGKHTTRHVELIRFDDFLVADTPGFSLVTFDKMSIKDIKDNFIEFNDYKQDCEYRDCDHINELKCEIKNQINKEILKSRYENYLNFVRGEL